MSCKNCTKCKKLKPYSEFRKDKLNKSGYRSECSECAKTKDKNYRRSKKGLISCIYNSQKHRSKKRGHPAPSYTKDELTAWLFQQPDFEKLYSDWVENDYSRWLAPSCDRTDDYLPYSLDRLNLVTWQFNHNKALNDRKNGRLNKISKAVLQLTKKGEIIKEYYSLRQAERETGIHNNHISSCCRNKPKYKSAGGFFWKYK